MDLVEIWNQRAVRLFDEAENIGNVRFKSEVEKTAITYVVCANELGQLIRDTRKTE